MSRRGRGGHREAKKRRKKATREKLRRRCRIERGNNRRPQALVDLPLLCALPSLSRRPSRPPRVLPPSLPSAAPRRRPLRGPAAPPLSKATSGDGGFPAPSSRAGDEGPLNIAQPASASTSPALSARSSSSSPLPSSSAPSLSPARRLPASRLARFLLTLPLELSAAGARTNDHYLARRKKKGWWSHRFPVVPGSAPVSREEEEEPASAPEPVSASAWAKALPLGAIFFCASFNLTILQNLKDALMVTAGGAETLPFLASVGVLPASLGFFVFYRALVERAGRRDAAAGAAAGGGGGSRSVFYLALLPLVAFYAFFAAVLYPSSAWLHPHGFYAALAPVVPAGLHGLLKVVEHWTFSLFFCVAELWGAVAISVLFWGLANEVCSVADARAIYPLMGVAANVALVVAGNYVKMVNAAVGAGSSAGAMAAANAAAASSASSASSTTAAAATAAAAAATDAAAPALRILVGTVVALSAAMCAAKAWVDLKVPRPPPDPKKLAKAKAKAEAKAAAEAAAAASPEAAALLASSSEAAAATKSEKKKKKKKKSLGDSLAALRAYPMISNLALLVVGYGVSHRLFEFAWKGALRQLHPSPLAYQAALADVSIATGYVSGFGGFFFLSLLERCFFF